MHRLSITVYSIVSPTLAGVGAVVALVAGITSLAGILVAAVFGACVALPINLLIAKALS